MLVQLIYICVFLLRYCVHMYNPNTVLSADNPSVCTDASVASSSPCGELSNQCSVYIYNYS